MRERYVRAMDVLHRGCLVAAGTCLVVITVIIPWGVFTRYVLNYGSSWPEPMAVLLMIWFSFVSAAVCYREGLHIGVGVLPDLLQGGSRRALGWTVEVAMMVISLFMLHWGVKLVRTTWFQVISDFPIVSTGISYLPVPVGGTIVALFVVERIWTGRFFEQPGDGAVAAVSTE